MKRGAVLKIQEAAKRGDGKLRLERKGDTLQVIINTRSADHVLYKCRPRKRNGLRNLDLIMDIVEEIYKHEYEQHRKETIP